MTNYIENIYNKKKVKIKKKKKVCSELEPVLQFLCKTNNPRGKPPCTSIHHKRSNINIQRKLSKQNIAETNNNITIAQKLLLNRQNIIIITMNENPQP